MPPARIVSLVPSLTELVAWLGAGDRLVGRTRFCTEPRDLAERVPHIGGTKNPNIERIVELAPDLVIANKEENRQEDIEALRRAGLDVLLTDPNTVEGAVEMIGEVGGLLECGRRAAELTADIRAALGDRPSPPAPLPTPHSRGRGEVLRVYVGVWHQPMMGLGSQSYGHSLVEACGAVNVLRERPRYPAVTFDEVAGLEPDLILLPDEPFPFDEGHARAYGAFAPTRVVDGKLLWWYGPRMPRAIRDLRALFAGVGA